MLPSDSPPRSWSCAELRRQGMTRRQITAAVRAGRIIRARRDVYVAPATSQAVQRAARVGGRLDGLSLMRELGVFVLESETVLHIQIPRHRSRLRSPLSRWTRLDGKRHRVAVHWRDDDLPADSLYSDFSAALARAIVDQRPGAAIATIDSALNQGFLRESDLGEVFALVPRRLHYLRHHVDGRAEAGAETFARLIAQSFDIDVEPQFTIDGVGRGDIRVGRELIVECDSRAYHGGWERQEQDRIRDLGFAARGFTVIRPTARQIFTEPHRLTEALAGLLGASPGVPKGVWRKLLVW